jgi:hypothetical protein
MLNSAEAVIGQRLEPGERLVWSGMPRGGIIFRWSDVLAIPFSLLWGGFAIFWEWTAVKGHAPLFFQLWGIPFVLVGLYIIVGRFLYDAALRANTYYGITDRRAIIVKQLFGSSVQSIGLSYLTDTTLSTNSDRSGSIYFGDHEPGLFDGANSWFVRGSQRYNPPAFEAIPGVADVYAQIRSVQLSRAG